MKYKGTLTTALVSLGIFLVFAIAGCICLAAGFGQYVQNSGVINSVGDLVEYVSDFNVNSNLTFSADTDRASAVYVRRVDDSIGSISIDSSGSSVTVRTGGSDEIRVSFSGPVTAGMFTELDENDVPVSAADVLDADYYAHDGIIKAKLTGDTLAIDVEAALQVFNINIGHGSIVVDLPAGYAGDLEVCNSMEESVISGCTFERLVLKDTAGDIEVVNCVINEAVLSDAAGEIEFERCRADMLVVENIAGEISAEGSFLGVRIENIAGEVSVESETAFVSDSVISDVAGEVRIYLPHGSALDVSKSGVFGEVSIDGDIDSEAGAPALEISNVFGEVAVKLD